MNRIQVQFTKTSARVGVDFPLPTYATTGSAGLDLRACLNEDVIIKPGERAKIPTGLAIQLPHAGVVGLVFARSGNAWKHGISLANAVGVIDSDYTGEVQVLITNFDLENDFIVKDGERIAQLVFMPVFQADLVEVEKLVETERGSGGFGSTGKA